jgi:peroxiredoxin
MIASLIAALLALAPQGLEDYLPGGPDRVHADALEWLDRATVRLKEHDTLQLEFTETLDGNMRHRVFYLQPDFAWEPAESASAKPANGWSGQDTPVTHDLIGNVWQTNTLSGCLPLLSWMELRGPGLAALRLELAPTPEVAARLHWIEDGLRGHVDLGADADLLGWTWRGDDCWSRSGTREVRVNTLRGTELLELPEDLQDVEPVFVDFIGIRTAPGEKQPWKTAKDTLQDILLEFSRIRCLQISAALTIQLGESQHDAIVLGNIKVEGDLFWPARGRLSMQGEIGPPDKRKQVNNEICGDGRQLWHWDHSNDQLRRLPGLADLLSGVQGILPVYAWAARAVPDSGWTAEWISGGDEERRWLQVVDGPTTTDFLVSRFAIHEAKVRTSNARSGAPVMHYRFSHLRSNSWAEFDDYGDSAQPLLNRLEREAAAQAAIDPRLAELLTVGERAPSAVEWTAADGGRESLSDLRGKPTLLCFWYRDATGCEPALRHLARLRGQLDRVGAASHFRAISIDEPLADAQTWLEEKSIALPLGVGGAAQLKRTFRARWLPTTYLIGTDGVVLGRWLGVPGRELEVQLRSLIARD